MHQRSVESGVDAGLIDDVRFGCCSEPIDALNLARVSFACSSIASFGKVVKDILLNPGNEKVTISSTNIDLIN